MTITYGDLTIIVPITIGILLIIIILYLKYTDKIDKKIGSFKVWLSKCFKSLQKDGIRRKVQGKINDYINSISRNCSFLVTDKVHIEYQSEDTNKKTLYHDNEVIIYLRRDDPKEQNTIRGAYYFISESFLRDAKRYMSPPQSEAINIYVTYDLIKNESHSAIEYFQKEFVTNIYDSKSKLRNYITSFQNIDESGLLYPLLFQELNCLA